ncbi:hypothetical protein FHR83_000789 [Actinoplanes campanulatus]|uniref:Uncharacterized protein n=1 Tax=Actinoplanes campanulatus TaxID=113559 RepID=A0A7W5ABY2_9ACTN|nr:hypothetical protein [Actinoplanes campanulatus]MBB3093155.1 hypothetical protein [Actinoplanes campanulatus]GGN01542.1 hypothetical protein GCM10010109_07170 [Actinoplanes campanulatus]GID33749.1 hypothetical protein Aca09nite_02550 [Actinoplanes campanulatus]
MVGAPLPFPTPGAASVKKFGPAAKDALTFTVFLLLVVGGVLFFPARRRKVDFTA